MNSMGVSRLRSSARGVIATVPGAGWVRSRGSADRAFPRWRAGPLPVLVIGAVVAIGQAVSHAWVSLDASLYWQASARLDNLYADGWTGAYNDASPPTIAQLWAPFHVLPFEVVSAAWTVFLFGCLWSATRSWALPIIAIGSIGFALGIPALAAPLDIILLGNVACS